MKNSTFKIIGILVGLLFLNIEAAQAGLVQKVKVFILTEFGASEFLYLFALLLFFGFLLYVVFAPVLIGKERWDAFRYFTFDPTKRKREQKASFLRHLHAILKNKQSTGNLH